MTFDGYGNMAILNKGISIQFSRILLLFSVLSGSCKSEGGGQKIGSCFCEPESDEVVPALKDWECPCWERCPVGQTWNGEKCLGQKVEATYSEAIGLNGCKRDVFGWESRIPHMDDYAAILDDCQHDESRSPQPVQCKPCAQSERCREMFGSDNGKYWCHNMYEKPYSINLGTGEFKAETDDAGVQGVDVRLNYRCARYHFY